jgi:hypothetical protein
MKYLGGETLMHSLKTGLKKWRWHLIPQLLLVAIVATILAAGSAQTSQAASLAPQTTSTHCQSLGALVESRAIKDSGGNIIGELDVYYNSATGYNCAYTQGRGQARGTSTVKGVTIYSCTNTKPGNGSCGVISKMTDDGNYLYYAGPVGVQAKGKCIAATGLVAWKGTNYYTNTQPFVGHCG